MNSTICPSGCSYEDRFFAGFDTMWEVHGTPHRVCANCYGRVIQDHDAHVHRYYLHLDWTEDARRVDPDHDAHVDTYHQHLDWMEYALHVDPDHGAHVDALHSYLDIRPSSYCDVDSFLRDRDFMIGLRQTRPAYFADISLPFDTD